MYLAQCVLLVEHVQGFVSTRIRTLFADERGQDLIEYALLGGFVSLVVVLTVTNIGTTVDSVFQSIDTQVGAIPAP